MALQSRLDAIMTAIAAVLNANADLASRNFKVRKKPYNRGQTWLAGGFVTPGRGSSPYHETAEDELVFKVRVTVVDPSNSDLTSGMASHLGAMERVNEIFRRKAHGFMPQTIRNLNTTFAAWASAGSVPASYVQMTDTEEDAAFVDAAFEAGYDASSIVISVRVTSQRYDSTGL